MNTCQNCRALTRSGLCGRIRDHSPMPRQPISQFLSNGEAGYPDASRIFAGADAGWHGDHPAHDSPLSGLQRRLKRYAGGVISFGFDKPAPDVAAIDVVAVPGGGRWSRRTG